MGPETLPSAGSDYNSRLLDEEYDAYTNDLDGSLCQEGNDGRPVLQLQVPVVDYKSEEYANSDDEVFYLEDTDDEGDQVRNVETDARFDPQCPTEYIKFKVGLKFDSRCTFRTTVRNYAIANGFNLKHVRSTDVSEEFKCLEGCPWRIYASLDQMKEYFVVKSLNNYHTCSKATRNSQVTYKWIANHFLDKFRTNYDWKSVDIMREIHEQLGVKVSRQTCSRAKAEARNMMEGSLEDHYHWLPCYVAELRRVYRGSTFEMVVERDNPDSLVRFKRLYVCFQSLANGFKHGCRPVIGLDGCFLKTVVKGQLLSVVGKDGNNEMYPISWAVVEGENENSWTWFITLLAINLNMSCGNGWTIMSDQQKVLH